LDWRITLSLFLKRKTASQSRVDAGMEYYRKKKEKNRRSGRQETTANKNPQFPLRKSVRFRWLKMAILAVAASQAKINSLRNPAAADTQWFALARVHAGKEWESTSCLS
jgi:hypothetical protein